MRSMAMWATRSRGRGFAERVAPSGSSPVTAAGCDMEYGLVRLLTGQSDGCGLNGGSCAGKHGPRLQLNWNDLRMVVRTPHVYFTLWGRKIILEARVVGDPNKLILIIA